MLKKIFITLNLLFITFLPAYGVAQTGAFFVSGPSGNILYTATNNMVWSSANAFVGIGTANPTTKLQVVGTINATTLVGNGAGITNVAASTSITSNYATTANYSTTSNFANTLANGVITNANLVTGNFTGITGVGTLSSLTMSGGVTGATSISAQSLSLSGVATASSFIGDGAGVTNISQSNLPSTSVSSNYSTLVTLTSLTVNGTVTTNTLIVNTTIGALTASANAFFRNVTANSVSAGTFNTISIDYAEYMESEGILVEGDIVGLNPLTGKARFYQPGDSLVGIVSTKPGVVGGEKGKGKSLIGLMGQLPFNHTQASITNRKIYTLDGLYIGLLLSNGYALIR